MIIVFAVGICRWYGCLEDRLDKLKLSEFCKGFFHSVSTFLLNFKIHRNEWLIRARLKDINERNPFTRGANKIKLNWVWHMVKIRQSLSDFPVGGFFIQKVENKFSRAMILEPETSRNACVYLTISRGLKGILQKKY